MENENILKGLNSAQREAVLAKDGAFVVVAGAGSGKTTVLSRRVANLIYDGVEPNQILLLTFTRASAKEMIERARRLHERAIDVTGGTFHSIAHRLVTENRTMLGFPEKLTILDPEDVKASFRKIAAEIGDKDENFPKAAALAKMHSFALNTGRDIEDIIADRHEDFIYATNFVTECREAYKKFKRERGLLDYDDLLVAWDKMLDHPEVAKKIRKMFRYVLVDEHQDSNFLQCSIIEKLGGPTPNVMVVGDPAQSIYGFRGSAPRTMFAFMEAWPGIKMINLEVNYRSTASILGVANAVDRSMRERFERQLKPVPNNFGTDPLLVKVPGIDDEASFIADEILEKKLNGVELHEQAVLVRSMTQARHVEAEFMSRKIPYRVVGGMKIVEAAHIKDLLSLARTVTNPMDEPAWIRVLTKARRIGDKKALKIFNAVRDAYQSGNDLSKVVIASAGKSEDIGDLVAARDAMALNIPPVEALSMAVERMKPIFELVYKEDWKTRQSDLKAVVDLADKHVDLAEFLSQVTLDYSVDKKSEGSPMDDSERPVTISTVHSAKGLEWDVVFIPSFIDGHIPSLFTRDIDGEEEERRVLYVAVTRPRKELVFVKRSLDREGRMVSPSRFEDIFLDMVVERKIGLERRPAGFEMGGLRASIDVFG
ncbi:ATP-dependent helicase [Roseibium sp. RKSG952]|uniref:ATP-dependent helicase n=1 Tax=Roseibium sp. RKSG952 TaxID=2529384 RepID=UPI0012BD114D|nr:ATP-dependent helicase [Roseibium sp. RKSG952]MTH94956.1 ATP-dependent helicase [Roseibium sp. RKSG952]